MDVEYEDYGDSDYSEEEEDDERVDSVMEEEEHIEPEPVVSHLNKPFRALSETEIRVEQDRLIGEITSILNVSPSAAAILLRGFKWNVNRVTDAWFSDEESIRSQFGLHAGESSQPPHTDSRCGICFDDDIPAEEMAALAMCGAHRFCLPCWQTYIVTAVADGAGCLSLRCPEPSCHAAVEDERILAVLMPDGEQASMAQLSEEDVAALSLPSTSAKEAPSSGGGTCSSKAGMREASAAAGGKGERHLEPMPLPVAAVHFNRQRMRSFVEVNEKVKWCPSPGCHFAMAVDNPSSSTSAAHLSEATSTVSRDVVCKCGHDFCWNCQEEPHRPVQCEVVRKWVSKNSAESENMNWLLANSKACPKCKRPIEKNHGCMHMTCTPPCRYEFCWLCLGDWKEHGEGTGGFYACNRYEGAKKKGELTQEEQRRERARQSLERYLHYYERWSTNEASWRRAKESLNEVEESQGERLREIMGVPAGQMSFLSEAWMQIVKCRRVLKWTYAYGFYLTDENATRHDFFEHVQGEAEKALGWLHKSAEKDMERFLPCRYRSSVDEEPMEMNPSTRMEEFVVFRSTLTRLTAVTRKYFENLMSALEGGLADISMPESLGANEVIGKGKGKAEVGSPDDNRKRRRGGAEGAVDGLELSLGLSRQAGGEASTSSGSALGNAAGHSRGSEDEERWSCVHCTYSNVGNAHQCRMCNLPRQAEGV